MRARRTLAYGTVSSSIVTAEGHFAEVDLEPDGRRVTCRVLPPLRGAFIPLEDGEEVVVGIPRDDVGTADGPVLFASAYSTPDPPPDEAVSDPSKIWIVTSGDVAIKCSTATVDAATVELGGASLSALTGVVQGEGIDPFTGATYAALNNASAVVRAKK